MRRPVLTAVALLAVVAPVLGAGCSGEHRTRSVAAVTIGGTGTFEPAVIHAFRDDRLVLRVSNLTDKTHGFSIQGYGIARTVSPGGHIRVETPAKVGTYRVFCQLHKTHQAVQLVIDP